MLYLLYKVWIQYFFLIPIVEVEQWGLGDITNSDNITLTLPVNANILFTIPFDISKTGNVYPLAWDNAIIENKVRIICSITGSNLIGYFAICIQ